MSSSPSTQPQDSANQSLERTHTRHSHRNRDHRSIKPGDTDSSGRDETSSDRRQRQNADRRRRHAPKGADVDGSRASSSPLVNHDHGAVSLHPQSNGVVSAGASPAPARTPQPDNRSRAPHSSRPVTSRVQDGKPQGSGQHRRAGRPNPVLSAPKADAPASASETNSPRKRGKAPPGDDLTSILTFSLSNPPFPECMICFNRIRPEQPTWSCSPREEKEAQSCWNTFHLKCIQPWAEKSVKDLEEAWRARGEEKKGEWRCPGCQSRREIVPRKYW